MRNSVKILLAGLFILSFMLSFESKKILSKLHAEREPASETAIVVTEAKPIVVDKNAVIIAYHFERKVQATLSEKGAKPLVDLDIHGNVFLTELEKTTTSRLLGLQFELSQGAEKEVHTSRVPFTMEVSNDLKIISLKHGDLKERTDEDDLNVLKDFASVYAYGSDRDTSGEYKFKLVKSADEIEKTKIAYEGAGVQLIKILSSKTSGKIESSNSEWVSAVGADQITMEGGKNQSLVTSTAFELKKVNGLKPKAEVMAYGHLIDTTLALVSHPEFAVKPWDELKRRLAEIKAYNHSQRLSLFHDLTKLLKSDAKMVGVFKNYIEGVAKEQGMMTFGIGVLATSGGQAAETALRDWYHGAYGVEHTVLNAFASTSAVLTDETRSFLKSIVGDREQNPDLAQNAAYAMGSTLKHGGDEEMRKALLGYFQASTAPTDRLAALDAIGNSGDEHFVTAIKQSIESNNTNEREKAVFSARFMPSDTAAPILAAGYQDGTLAVRKASVRALAYQDNLAPHTALIQECANEGDRVCQGYLSKLNQ